MDDCGPFLLANAGIRPSGSQCFEAKTHLLAIGVPRRRLFAPEQVWDNQPPSGQTVLQLVPVRLQLLRWPWAHAQFIRLAFDIAAGRLLEQPPIVARRYLQHQVVIRVIRNRPAQSSARFLDRSRIIVLGEAVSVLGARRSSS
jgi:hypothetical protein